MLPLAPYIPKPSNYLPLILIESYTLPADTYNVVYANSNTALTLTLPSVSSTIDGMPLFIKNIGSGTLTVNSDQNVLVTTLATGFSVMLVCSKTFSAWELTIGPVNTSGGIGFVSSSGTSTDTAVARWLGTTGTEIQDSTVLIDNSGNITGTTSYSLGSGNNRTALTGTPAGVNTWTFRAVSDSVVGLASTDTLTNKTITDTSNNVAANSLNTTGTAVNVSGASPPPGPGYILTSTGTTAATWQAPAVSGASTTTTFAITRWGNTTGSSLLNSTVTLDSVGNIAGVNGIVYGSGSNSLTLAATPSGTHTLTIPNATDTLVGRATTDTLSNKTIDYTPGTSGNWLSTPTTVAGALDDLAYSAGTNLTLGYAAVTAAGSTQGTATPITAYLTQVNNSPSNAGVILPSAIVGRQFYVLNRSSNSIVVYPQVGQSIEGVTNTGVTLAANSLLVLAGNSSTNYVILFTIASA
jgi:hypothetical protein